MRLVKPSNASGQGEASRSDIFSSITNGIVMPSTEREEPNIGLSLGGEKGEEKTMVVWK